MKTGAVFLLVLMVSLFATFGCSGTDAPPPISAPPGDDDAPSDEVPVDETPSDETPIEDDVDSGAIEEPIPSSGCALPPPESGEMQITVDGILRTCILDIPTDYDPVRPYPLVFGFHGRGLTAESFRSENGLVENMGRYAVIVHPDAIGSALAWELNNTQDLTFFDALVDDLSRRLCIDLARVFVTGFSRGAYFSNMLGCQRGDVVRAIAPVAGGGPELDVENPCTGQVAVWLAHGETDDVVSLDSGQRSLDYWLEANGCTGSFNPIDASVCVAYQACDAGYPVQWCVHEGDHIFPDFAPDAIAVFFFSFCP